ncbi:uncharacterized protein LOC126263469 [Schistocerca nitens]|uniref:uncharacterized protein LOC126263469 n=1 Tax=Schistocerca nitens TaxID=7011 RepID=UPI0021190A1F|nr:uncharacterized protein LOC126263469 [Schistocerca nitens]
MIQLRLQKSYFLLRRSQLKQPVARQSASATVVSVAAGAAARAAELPPPGAVGAGRWVAGDTHSWDCQRCYLMASPAAAATLRRCRAPSRTRHGGSGNAARALLSEFLRRAGPPAAAECPALAGGGAAAVEIVGGGRGAGGPGRCGQRNRGNRFPAAPRRGSALRAAPQPASRAAGRTEQPGRSSRRFAARSSAPLMPYPTHSTQADSGRTTASPI